MDAMDRIERLLVLWIQNDDREIRRQREETKRLKALFKQREEEFALRMEQSSAETKRLLSKLQRDPLIEDGTEQPDPPIKDGTETEPSQ